MRKHRISGGGGDDYLGCQRLFLVTIASASNFDFLSNVHPIPKPDGEFLLNFKYFVIRRRSRNVKTGNINKLG